MNIPCLPPVDITICQEVPTPFDVVDVEQWDFIFTLCKSGAIMFIHCGTPRNTFSSARKLDGGPPPLRSTAFPLGLPGLSEENMNLVFLGNLFLIRSAEACAAVFAHGGNFSIENPEASLLWCAQPTQTLLRICRAFLVSFDQCEFGAPSVKPTTLMVSHQVFTSLERRCNGGHQHVRLHGKVWSSFFQKEVFRTKLAQVYPARMCSAMASCIVICWDQSLPQFNASFSLTSDKRKRPVGQPLRWRDHRQALTALKAEAAGYQLKRGARKPLLDMETEPGVAIAWALAIPHPLSVEVELDDPLKAVILRLARSPEQVKQQRQHALQHCNGGTVQWRCSPRRAICSRQCPIGPCDISYVGCLMVRLWC